MKTHIALIVACMAASAAFACYAQRTTRPNLRLEHVAQSPAPADTIKGAAIALSGYEKTLTSAKESLLASNHSADTISEIGVTIDYLDTKGRQLHRRSVKLTPSAPMAPGQTRQFEFKSWDTQRVWHYRLSGPPRTNRQATPYDVKVSVDYAIKITPQPKK